MHHAGAGHNDADAGALGQIAVRLRRVGGGLLVAHADIGNSFLLRGCGNRGDGKPDDPEQVIDALLFQAFRYQGRPVDFAHAFLLVREPRDYALTAKPRRGFCQPARHLAVHPDAHARNRHLLMHRRELSVLMKSRRRIAFPKLGLGGLQHPTHVVSRGNGDQRNGIPRSNCNAEFLHRYGSNRSRATGSSRSGSGHVRFAPEATVGHAKCDPSLRAKADIGRVATSQL